MPRGKKYQDQKEIKETVVSEPGSASEESKATVTAADLQTEEVKTPTPAEEKKILALLKEPFVSVGDEFEIPEVGKVKVMDLFYHKIVKIPGPVDARGLPTFEDKRIRERITTTGDAEPDYLPAVKVIYQVPGKTFRDKPTQETVGLEEFYKLIPAGAEAE